MRGYVRRGRLPLATTRTNPRASPLCLSSPHPAPLKGSISRRSCLEGGLQVGYWRLNVSRYYLRLATPTR